MSIRSATSSDARRAAVERFAEERPLALDINFLKEARYGQTLSVALEERGSQTLVEIRSDAGAALCRGAFEWR